MHNKNEQYFGSGTWMLNEDKRTHEILQISRVSKETAEMIPEAIKISYKDGVVSEFEWIQYGFYEKSKLSYDAKPLKYREYPINHYRSLFKDEEGQHYLGGCPPNNFIMPDNPTTTTYVYLAKINSKEEELLHWVGIDELHLICPIHSDIETLYLDYSKPFSPVLVNNEDQAISTAFECLTTEDEIVFKPLNVKMSKNPIDYKTKHVLGNIGTPAWMQDERIPKCPITGKTMKYLITLESNHLMEIEVAKYTPKEKYDPEYIETFDFWGAGALYIFFEPSSKIMAYFIQNS